ncbi:unnamed protein product, partial [Protopolystoma xenopodis]
MLTIIPTIIDANSSSSRGYEYAFHQSQANCSPSILPIQRRWFHSHLRQENAWLAVLLGIASELGWLASHGQSTILSGLTFPEGPLRILHDHLAYSIWLGVASVCGHFGTAWLPAVGAEITQSEDGFGFDNRLSSSNSMASLLNRIPINKKLSMEAENVVQVKALINTNKTINKSKSIHQADNQLDWAEGEISQERSFVANLLPWKLIDNSSSPNSNKKSNSQSTWKHQLNISTKLPTEFDMMADDHASAAYSEYGNMQSEEPYGGED